MSSLVLSFLLSINCVHGPSSLSYLLWKLRIYLQSKNCTKLATLQDTQGASTCQYKQNLLQLPNPCALTKDTSSSAHEISMEAKPVGQVFGFSVAIKPECDPFVSARTFQSRKSPICRNEKRSHDSTKLKSTFF